MTEDDVIIRYEGDAQVLGVAAICGHGRNSGRWCLLPFSQIIKTISESDHCIGFPANPLLIRGGGLKWMEQYLLINLP
jgi:hypothetical protein